MSNARMDQFVTGLKSKNEETRIKTANELHSYASTELRELSVQELQAFMDKFNNHIHVMVNSSDINEKKGGIYAIMSLIDIDVGQTGQQICRFANYLRAIFNSADSGVMELTAKAVGCFALASGSGSITADYIEDLVKRSFEWLEGERVESRRLAAVLVLHELALAVPTSFFQQVNQFLDVIFNAVQDPKANIREGAVAALRVVLVITTVRETKKMQHQKWYNQCLEHIWDGFSAEIVSKKDSGGLTREDRVHGSLLVLNELLRCSSSQWERHVYHLRHLIHYQTPVAKKDSMSSMMKRLRGQNMSLASPTPPLQDFLASVPLNYSGISGSMENTILDQQNESKSCRELLLSNYDKICNTVINQFPNKNRYIQTGLLQVLPRLAALNKEKFSESYLEHSMNHLLAFTRSREKERPNAFISLGLLSVAIGPSVNPYMPALLEVFKTSLTTKDMTSSKKKHVVEPAVNVCVSLVARSVKGSGLAPCIKYLLEPMMAGGLSPPLTLALQELAIQIPELERDISELLSSMLSQILIQKPGYTSSHSRPSSQSNTMVNSDHQDTASIVLALKTLGTFQFEASAQTLMLFVRNVADHYLTSECREIRLEAVPTCCHLLRRIFPNMSPRVPHIHQDDQLSKKAFKTISQVLWACTTDSDPEVRKCVLESLDSTFDGHLAQPENIPALIFAMNDEVFEIQEYAISIVGRLSAINAAYVHPHLRKTLLKILDELDYSGIGRNRELSAKLLGHLIHNAPRFMRQFVQIIMKILVPKLKDGDNNPAVTISVLKAIGDLAEVSGCDMTEWVEDLLPHLLEMLGDSTSGWKRQVALLTLGKLVENTAFVVHPYDRYPNLLDILLSFLKTEHQPAIRRETLHVLGLLGARDPYKHKMNVGTIKIQQDTGVALISVARPGPDEDMSGEMTTSEMLVNLNYSSLEDFYPACAVAMLMRVIRDPTLSQYHNYVVQAVIFIFKSLGVKGVPYLSCVIPSLLKVIRGNDTISLPHRDFLFTQLSILIGIVGEHIRAYIGDIVSVLRDFWIVGGKMENTITIVSVIESMAIAVGTEFKTYLKGLIPMISKSLINDSDEWAVTNKLLLAFQKFTISLEFYLNMVLPHIVKLFDASTVPINVRKTAIETVDRFSYDIDLRDYTSEIIHPLLRTIDSTPDLRTPSLKLLCSMVIQLGQLYECFIPVVYPILTRHHITHPQYEILVAKLIKGLDLTDGNKKMLDSSSHNRKVQQKETDSSDTTIIRKKAVMSTDALQKAWSIQHIVSKDDWLEWLRRFSIELIRASPSPSIKSCLQVATNYPQLSRDLFNAAFVSCWSELTEALQDDLLKFLRQALTQQDIPEITQTLLNLAEFMEHCEKGPLPLELQLVGSKAIECRAYAKALHYKEEEFHKGVTSEVLESLISINNKLGQKEAAAGLLEYTKKNNKTDIQVQERWFEKLHDWDEALQAYKSKLEHKPDDFELALGQMRCLEALGQWGELSNVASERWSKKYNLTEEQQCQMSKFAAAASWTNREWDMMEEYTKYIPRDTHEGTFYRAVLAINHQQYPVALRYIRASRDLLDTELTAMIGESYQRAYNCMVHVQMLAELEEVIQYKLVPEQRISIIQNWWQRLQGCQHVVEDWQKILQVRSLVLEPQDDMRPWLKFASLCRKSNRLALSHKVLVTLLGDDLMVYPHPTITHPHVTYQFCKHMYSTNNIGKKWDAYAKLQNFLNYLDPLVNDSDKKLRKLTAKVYLKLGSWHEQLHGLSIDTLRQILPYYTNAKDVDPTCYKAWHTYACMNFEALLLYKAEGEVEGPEATEEISKEKKGSFGSIGSYHQLNMPKIPQIPKPKTLIAEFAAAAVTGFMRSLSLSNGNNSVQDTLRLLTVWFEQGHLSGVYETLNEGLKTIKIDTWLQVIPQLIARIDSQRQLVGKLIHSLLIDIGKHHPQALIYPLTVTAKSSERARSAAAEKVLKNMREHSCNLVQQAMMVSEELIRIAILWNERWYGALEEASRLYFGDKDEAAMFRTLKPLHAMMERGPATLKEMSFEHSYGRELRDANDWCKRYHRSGNAKDLSQAWDLYYQVFKRITKQIPHANSLELNSVSPRLLNCRDMEIAVPGSYAPNAPLITIASVNTSLKVLSSKQRPRKLCIHGSDGNNYYFLLKGHEDLRQDERVMQLFGLVNTLLIGNPDTFRRNLTIQRYAVIPLSTNSGLIGWVPNCDTLHVLIRDWREKKKIILTIEHRLMTRMAPDLDHLTLMQKVEVFEHALEHTQGDDLSKLLWYKSPSSEVWFDRRTNYTRSLAVMSMVGYVLGLGDRHPSNLMLDQLTGKIIHIDFGDCFEVAMTREKFPEKIPFRLTRMLVNAMEVPGIDGTYRMTCESVMSLLRRNKDSLMAMLEAFVYDPLLNWRLIPNAHNKAKKKSDEDESLPGPSNPIIDGNFPEDMCIGATSQRDPTKTASDMPDKREDNAEAEAANKKAVTIVNRVKDKLTGRDFCRDPNAQVLTVHKQVDLLIDQATSHENLCQLYVGWCPFW